MYAKILTYNYIECSDKDYSSFFASFTMSKDKIIG